MFDSNASSHPQTMRRQRTEVVVELRKVNAFASGSHAYCKQHCAFVRLGENG